MQCCKPWKLNEGQRKPLGLHLQDVVGRGEDLQDLVLDLLQLARVRRALQDELLLLLLQVLPLLRHHNVQQLVLQPLRGDHEVDQRDLDRRLGGVVRVAELCGDVEPELVRELDRRIA